MTANPALRIGRLRALIDHPRTGDGERDVALRMLNRILGKSAMRPPSGDRTYGSRHDRGGRHAGLEGIAEMIRHDIDLVRNFTSASSHSEMPAVSDPLADVPRAISFHVTVVGPATISVAIDNIPIQWGWRAEFGIRAATPALQALADELALIINSYNRDGSDIHRRFFAKVSAEGNTIVW